MQRHLCKLAEGYSHKQSFKIYNNKVKLGSANQNIYIYICMFIPRRYLPKDLRGLSQVCQSIKYLWFIIVEGYR